MSVDRTEPSSPSPSQPPSLDRGDLEFMLELMALRDEKVLRSLSEEDRRKITEATLGQILYVELDEAAAMSSNTKGFWCNGPKGYTFGVVCKKLKLGPIKY